MGLFNKYRNSEIINLFVRHDARPRISSEELKSLMSSKEDIKQFNRYLSTIKSRIIKEYRFPEEFIDKFFENEEIFTLENNGTSLSICINFRVLTYMLYANLISNNDDFEFIERFDDEKDNEVLGQAMIQKFRDERKKFSNINAGEELDQYIRDNTFFMAMLAKDLMEHDRKSSKEMRFQDIVKLGTEKFTDVIFSIRNLSKNIRTYNIDLDGYTSIDKDTLAFYITAKVINSIGLKKEVNNSIYYCINYYLRVKDKINKDYEINLRGFDRKNGGYVWYRYRFSDFINILQNYILDHPEIRMETVDEDFFEGWTIQEIMDYYSELNRETMEYFDTINPYDIFLPYGEVEKRNRSEEPQKIKSKRKPKNEITTLVLEKRAFYARNLSKIHKTLLGKDKFLGYIANIFKNGYVIFEKYDVNYGLVSTKPGAAYIMTIDNFEKLCNLTIKEIREISKKVKNDPNSGFGFVDYKCHSGEWQSYLQSYIDANTGIDLGENIKRKKLCQSDSN